MYRERPQGLLGCPACLKTAGWLTAVLIIGGMYFVWWLGNAIGSQGLSFTACSQDTCQPPTKEQITTLGGASLNMIVDPGHVVAVSTVAGCPSCSKLHIRDVKDKTTFYIMGSPSDISCRVWAGEHCRGK